MNKKLLIFTFRNQCDFLTDQYLENSLRGSSQNVVVIYRFVRSYFYSTTFFLWNAFVAFACTSHTSIDLSMKFKITKTIFLLFFFYANHFWTHNFVQLLLKYAQSFQYDMRFKCTFYVLYFASWFYCLLVVSVFVLRRLRWSIYNFLPHKTNWITFVKSHVRADYWTRFYNANKRFYYNA